MTIECDRTRALFSDALDGALSGRAMQTLQQHAATCPACAEDFAAWRRMQHALAALPAKPAPADMGLRLRIAASHARAREAAGFFVRIFSGWDMLWQNSVRPLALQCSAGLASALCLLAVVGLMIGMFADPQRVQASSAKDEPLGVATAPHFLYSMLPTGTLAADVDSAIVVEVFLGADGRVYDYKILAGEDSPGVRAQLNSALYFSVFTPARVFGRPVPGHVVLSYAGIAVHG